MTAFVSKNEEAFYWLGVLFADGSGSNWNRISLKSKDPVFLQKFADYVGKDMKETKGERSVVYVVEFSDKTLRDRLLGLGFTRTVKADRPIPKLPNSMVQHFLRGYFDGDGSIHKDHRKKNCWRLEIATHVPTSEAIKNLLKKSCPAANIGISRRSTSERLLVYNASGVAEILKFLYKDAKVSPHQKAVKAQSLIGVTL